MAIEQIEAVLFDMDGTLIDSEGQTERAVERLLVERNLPVADVDFGAFHGITWPETADQLEVLFPVLASEPVADLLPQIFHELFTTEFPPLIGGSREAVVTAAERFPTAIVTSGARISVEHLLDHLELRPSCRTYVCAEDCERSKPDPQGYLLAAERLEVEPSRCLVFEDSVVGMRAARSAGMHLVAITEVASEEAIPVGRQLAELVVRSFRELPPGFFSTIAASACT